MSKFVLTVSVPYVPLEFQLMSIQEHEVIDDNLDTTRPYFHPPSVSITFNYVLIKK
jgi:hypothetical protein